MDTGYQLEERPEADLEIPHKPQDYMSCSQVISNKAMGAKMGKCHKKKTPAEVSCNSKCH